MPSKSSPLVFPVSVSVSGAPTYADIVTGVCHGLASGLRNYRREQLLDQQQTGSRHHRPEERVRLDEAIGGIREDSNKVGAISL